MDAGSRGKKKDEWSDGWMGGALAWLQSQFLIGCRLGNGTSDLIYPFYAPLAVRALCSRPCTTSQHTFFPSPCHSSLRALTPLLVSRFFFFFLLTLFSQVWLPPRRAGEKVKSGNAFSCHRAAGEHSELTHQHAVFEQRKYKRDADCKAALLSIYMADSNFIPPREITGKLILGSDRTTHGEQRLRTTELCQKRVNDGFRRPAAVSKCSDGLVSILIAPVGPESRNFP